MLSSSLHHPDQNHLLGALPAIELGQLIPHLELIHMPLGDPLCEAGERLPYAYFPTSAIISLHYILENGASAEIASVGREGMFGIALLMGSESIPCWATVQAGGYGYRLKAALLLQKFHNEGPLQCLLLRYTHAFITQIAQACACNRYHSVEQQLCRWFLLTLDRLGSGELTMTHELIANLLGVRREGITEAAGKLQQEGIIRYRRGHITVLDRTGLQDGVCECYEVVKKEFDRLFHDARKCEDHGSPGRSDER
ncbi:MAG: Crp/Fnr family transcriptional regulator [Nitrosospira sp.]